jgi:hypothetical protein
MEIHKVKLLETFQRLQHSKTVRELGNCNYLYLLYNKTHWEF